MKFSTVFVFAATAAAVPWGDWKQWKKPSTNCLTDEQAAYIQERSRIFQLKANLTEARAAGEELFAADEYKQYGHSINSLRGDAVSYSKDFTSQANFISLAPSSSLMDEHMSRMFFLRHRSPESTALRPSTTAHTSWNTGTFMASVDHRTPTSLSEASR